MTTSDAQSDVGRSSPFVGRWSELQWLQERAREARGGRPHIALIVGDAGVGKSTLARELARDLDDVAVVAGRCRETVRMAYSPFRDSLFPLLDSYLADHPAEGRYQDLVAQLSEAIRSPVGDANELEARTHQRLVDAAVLAVEMARERMLVVVLDDIHWADESTLALLEALAAQMADASLMGAVPILLVATLRPPGDDEHRSAVERLEREAIASALHLEGLPRLDMAAFARSVAGRSLSDRELTELLDATDGNPLYAEAVLRRGHGQRLPVHIRDAIAGPIEDLSTPVREALEAASFLDDGFTAVLLAGVLDRAVTEVIHQLDEGAQARVVEATGDEWTFSHPLYRRMLHESASPVVAQRIHAQIAQTIRSDAALDVRALAQHLAHAGDLVDDADVVRAALEAGRLEFGACNWARACEHFAVVEQRCGLHEADQLGVDLAKLHHETGQALVYQGEVGAGLRHYDEAARMYAERSDLADQLHVLTSRCQAEVTSGELGDSIDNAEMRAALERAQHESPGVAAEAMATLAQTHWVVGRLDAAVLAAEQAITLARQAGVDEVEVMARVVLAMVAWTRFEPEVARTQLELAQQFAASASHPARRVGALNRLPITLLWLGLIGEAAEQAERAIEVGDAIRFRRELGLPVTALAMVDTLRGDLPHAEYLIRRALTVDRMTSYSWASVFARPLLAVLCDLQGRFDEAAVAIDELEEMMGPTSNWTRAARLLHTATGVRRGETSRIGDAPIGLDPEAAPSIGVAGLAAAHVELADAMGDPSLAAHAVPLLEAADRRGLVCIGSVGILVQRSLGKALVLAGDVPTGIGYLEAALNRAVADRAAVEIARTSRDLASALRRRDDEGDAARAADLDTDHLRICQVLDLRGLLVSTPTPLTPVPGRSEDLHRSVVVIVDICESTALAERLGDVAYAHELRNVLGQVYAVAAGHGGRVINHTGDGALIAFDEAAAAIDCAFDCHAVASTDQAALHFGVHAGEVVELDGNLFGAAVNTAARLCDQAGPRETVVSAAVRGLVGNGGRHSFDDRGQPALKGLSEALQLYAVVPA